MTEIHLSDDDRVYKNADEVVAAGLRLLGSEKGKFVEWQRLVQEGLDDVAAGRVRTYGSGEEFLADIKRMAAEKQGKTGNGHQEPTLHLDHTGSRRCV